MDPVLISVSALTVYSDSVSVALTVPHSIVFSLLTGYANGHELFVLHFQSPPSQLLVLQAIDEYHCVSVQCHPHTKTLATAASEQPIMGCSLAAVADMSHLHSAHNTLV